MTVGVKSQRGKFEYFVFHFFQNLGKKTFLWILFNNGRNQNTTNILDRHMDAEEALDIFMLSADEVQEQILENDVSAS